MAETEEQLFTGTSKNAPAITEIETSWAKPWLFSRLIIACIALTVALIMTFNQYPSLKLLPNIIFIGTFVMPLATVIFFMELNAPRNISIYHLLVLVFLSGVISLFVTFLISNPLSFFEKMFSFAGPAAYAPFLEEPAKILVVILVMMKVKKYKWILNGLLIGAAVGAGFGAFESAGYAFEQFVGSKTLREGYDALVSNITIRGLLAPFMHVIWTANAAGALWIAKGDKPFSWNLLASPVFLRVFLLSIVLHFLWNADFSIVRIPLFADAKYLILGFVAWTTAFMIIQTGLKQLNLARKAEVDRLAAA
jgi:RsiW-degrading membrane proteinase PrsW (M82 family)